MQIFSLELKRTNEIVVYKRHGLNTKAQKVKIKVPQRNEPACTLVPPSTFPWEPKQGKRANGINIIFILLNNYLLNNIVNIYQCSYNPPIIL